MGKKLFEQLTDFDLGKQEMAEWLKNQFERELAELKHLRAEEILRWKPETIITAATKYQIFEHYLKQIEKISNEIYKED